MTSEFSRRIALDTIGNTGRTQPVAADAGERAALARRFGLIRLDRLDATVTVVAVAGGVRVDGHLDADVVQACVVTGDPVAATLHEAFALRYVDAAPLAEEETELADDDLDVLPLEDGGVDVGEAVAQTMGLALDPFPRSPAAREGEERKWRAGPDDSPFAALKGLVK